MKISLNLLRKLINEEIRVCLTEESNAVKQLKSEKAKKELEIADIAQKIADETSKEAERTAARAKAKREVLGKLTKMQPTAKKKKVERKADKIDRKTVKMTRVLKKQEPKRIKAARASRLKK